MRPELHGATGPFDRRDEIAAGLAPRDECPRGSGYRLLQPRPLPLLPVLELGGARYEEAVQQVTAVQLERPIELFGRDRLIERSHITPQARQVEPDLLVAARDHGLRAQGAPQDVQGLAQCGAGVVRAERRPEQGERRVAAVQTAATRCSPCSGRSSTRNTPEQR